MLVLPFHQHVQVYLLVKTKNINLHQNHLQFSEKVVILKCFAILIVQVMADMPSNIGVKKECCHIIRTVTILCVGFKLEIIKRLVPFELIMAYLKVADWCHEYEFKFHQHQSYKKGIKLREFKQANLTIKKSHLVGGCLSCTLGFLFGTGQLQLKYQHLSTYPAVQTPASRLKCEQLTDTGVSIVT